MTHRVNMVSCCTLVHYCVAMSRDIMFGRLRTAMLHPMRLHGTVACSSARCQPGLLSLFAAGLCQRRRRASSPRQVRSGSQPRQLSKQDCRHLDETMTVTEEHEDNEISSAIVQSNVMVHHMISGCRSSSA
jgi:hypothetical protein